MISVRATCLYVICFKAACLLAVSFDMLYIKRAHAHAHAHAHEHTNLKGALECTNSKKAHSAAVGVKKS